MVEPRSGFTLIEVLIALAICAATMVVFSMTTQVNLHAGRVMQIRNQAAMLARGAVLDVESKIRKEGVPSNSVEGRPCDLPDDFKEKFKCEYDLMKFEMEEEQLSEMLQEVTAKLMTAFGGNQNDPKAPPDTSKLTGANVGSIIGDGKNLLDSSLGKLLTGEDKTLGGIDLAQMTPLLPLIMDTTGEFQRFCNFNLQNALLNFGLVITMFPVLAKELADRTRQLRLRISWKDSDARSDSKGQTLEIVTYVTFIDKELKLEEGDTNTDGNDPGTPPPPSPGGTR
ncbi:MAG: prepilin-type N-terminal cleavage/methylation domain-containing protein [Myxococcales bacterium]|nr:prepilin-type N-terminal cleavage/methylation domain-containing protein [Myxococcales bacterium]